MNVVTPTNDITTTTTTSTTNNGGDSNENNPTRILQQRPSNSNHHNESRKTLRYSLIRLQRSLSPRKVFSSFGKSYTTESITQNQTNERGFIYLSSKSTKLSSSSLPHSQSSRHRLDTASTTGSLMLLNDPDYYNNSNNNNCMYWLQHSCPSDVIPKILSHLKPQLLQNLACTNKYWNECISSSEPVWKTICEDTYKWTPDDPLPTGSWKEYYTRNPCVPLDYPTISAALAATAVYDEEDLQQSGIHKHTRTLRIYLKPQKYVLKESIVLRVAKNVSITIQTLPTPPSSLTMQGKHSESTTVGSNDIGSNSSLSPRRRKAVRVRNMLNCRSASAVTDNDSSHDAFQDPMMTQHSTSAILEPLNTNPPCRPPQAQLTLKTRKHNQPIIAVRQGHVRLMNITLDHYSSGLDIWNGNAALQVQQPLDPNNGDRPIRVFPRPSVYCGSVDVMSRSGRGIVSIDGGYATIVKSYIHDCAATGIYVGGSDSRALMDRVDVMENGFGNTLSRRGIARGHSGVYLEQGTAKVVNCNISKNALTGISTISPDNAFLLLSNSDLVSNMTVPLEMPPPNTNSTRRSDLSNNHMVPHGEYRLRSGLVSMPNPTLTTSLMSTRTTTTTQVIVENEHHA